jgi:hypothetical protein
VYNCHKEGHITADWWLKDGRKEGKVRDEEEEVNEGRNPTRPMSMMRET